MIVNPARISIASKEAAKVIQSRRLAARMPTKAARAMPISRAVWSPLSAVLTGPCRLHGLGREGCKVLVHSLRLPLHKADNHRHHYIVCYIAGYAERRGSTAETCDNCCHCEALGSSVTAPHSCQDLSSIGFTCSFCANIQKFCIFQVTLQRR